MTTQLRSARFRVIGHMSTDRDGQTTEVGGLDRLIPIALVLYLTPVLLIVLMAGGIGMLVLGVARVCTAVVKGTGRRPRASDQTRSPLV